MPPVGFEPTIPASGWQQTHALDRLATGFGSSCCYLNNKFTRDIYIYIYIYTNNRIPKSTIYKELEDETITNWQKEWEESQKAALTKQFFPSISDIIKAKMHVTPNFTALVTGHGKTRAYLHRFKLLESPTCPCGKEEQTTDHLICRCILLKQPRETLKRETSKQGTWPTTKQDLINKHLKQFMKFTNSTDFNIL